jgi:DNA-binding HxlR family transcriptional regulator
MFFEEVIRENLDLGRPDEVELIFDRKIRRDTPGVTPSLNVYYKNTRIKQYHKEGRALRTETTINDTWDFRVGKRLHNLPRLREIGFQANRRLLEVERVTHDCILAEETFRTLNGPVEVNGQRASALRFADPKVQALWHALVLFRVQTQEFRHADLRGCWAALTGRNPSEVSQGTITYQLRRLRLHGMIERAPHTHRYRVTPMGLRAALFCTRSYTRLLRPGLAFGPATEPSQCP